VPSHQKIPEEIADPPVEAGLGIAISAERRCGLIR